MKRTGAPRICVFFKLRPVVYATLGITVVRLSNSQPEEKEQS